MHQCFQCTQIVKRALPFFLNGLSQTVVPLQGFQTSQCFLSLSLKIISVRQKLLY